MRRLLSLFLLLLSLLAPDASAQSYEKPQYMNFDSGDLDYRTHTHVSLLSVEAPSVLMVAEEGLTALVFLARPDGGTAWLDLANEMGWNSFALDMVGCGQAPALPDDDLVTLVEKNIWGVLQMGVAPTAEVVIAQGVPAAYAIKARADDPRASKAAVLIDAVGPPGSQPWPELDSRTVLEQSRQWKERLWVKWGFGPRPGESYPDASMGEAEFEKILGDYERDQPPYWAAVMTRLDAGLEVREPLNLVDWPVLLARSPHRSAEEIEREDALAAWLSERGARVERLELSTLGLVGLTALPMLDPHADALLEHFIRWAEGVQPES